MKGRHVFFVQKTIPTSFTVWSPFYWDLSLRSSHVRGVQSGKNDRQLASSREAKWKASGTGLDNNEENEITKYLVYSDILRHFIVVMI
jgi:hypothetical protein